MDAADLSFWVCGAVSKRRRGAKGRSGKDKGQLESYRSHIRGPRSGV